MTSDQWETVRANRPPYREDVPVDDEETNAAKAARVQVGFKTLRQKLAEVRPDVLVVFGDDQNEMFDFNNHPSLAVYVGDSFEGKKPGTTAGFLGGAKPDAPPAMEKVLGHPELATHILTGLLARGFDPAFMIDNPKPERACAMRHEPTHQSHRLRHPDGAAAAQRVLRAAADGEPLLRGRPCGRRDRGGVPR